MKINVVERKIVLSMREVKAAEELDYADAEQLLADGKSADAAIAFGKLGNYSDARERSLDLWHSFRIRKTIVEGNSDLYEKVFLGIKEEGTVISQGVNLHGECSVGDWTNIIEVYTNGYISFGLRKDGTIAMSDVSAYFQTDKGLMFDARKKISTVQDWTNIEALYVTEENDREIWGLTTNGRVYYAGYPETKPYLPEISTWTDIVEFYDCNRGTEYDAANDNLILLENYLGLRMDGTVVHAGESKDLKRTVETWNNIVKIKSVSNEGFVVGWQSDGTVVSWGKPDSMTQTDLLDTVDIVGNNWKGYALLKRDGTVSTVPGSGDAFCEAENWQDIQTVYCYFHLIGITSEGTVLTERGTDYQKFEPKSGEWTDIADVYADDISIGLRKDGTVYVSEERYIYPLKDWSGIRLPAYEQVTPPDNGTDSNSPSMTYDGFEESHEENSDGVQNGRPQYTWNDPITLDMPLAAVQITMRKVENIEGAKTAYAIEIMCDSMTSKELMTFMIHSTDDWGFNRISLVERIQKVLDMYDDAWMNDTMMYCSMSGYGIEWTVSLGTDEHFCGIIGLTTNKSNEFEAVLGMMPQA